MTISQELFVKLRNDIMSGKLKSGTKLTEVELTKLYDVSRTPIRSALVRLEIVGLVKNIPNRGAYVCGMSSKEYDDILILRELHEVQATKWAIERADEKGLEELRELLDFMEFYVEKKDIAKIIKISSEFHNKILHLTGNQLLIRELSTLQELIDHRTSASYISDHLMQIFEEHKRIFAAFENCDVSEGANAMRDHLKNSGKRHKNR